MGPLKAGDGNQEASIIDYIQVIDAHDPMARVGDVVPFNYLEHVRTAIPEYEEIRLSIDFIKTNKAPEQYLPSPVKEYTWGFDRNENYDIVIRERLSNISENFKGKLVHKLQLEIENTGNIPINKLQFEIQWFDIKSVVSKTETVYITINSRPKIRRGHVRLFGRTWISENLTPDTYKNYTIKVSQIE